MTRYADPLRCPDCRTGITPAVPACPRCGLLLRGETAQRLFGTLSLADDLLRTLRTASDALPVAAPGPVPAGAGPARSGMVAGLPAYPSAAAGPHPGLGTSPRRRVLGAASVPRILLTLGAGCLLVAALVFLAVAWAGLGVAGRTAALLALTAVAAGTTSWLAGRALRAATEAVGVVGLGLLALDVLGARHAGWLGPVGTPAFLVLLGGALVLAGAGSAWLVEHRSPVRLVGGELVAALGVALAASGTAAQSWLPGSPALVLATVAAAAAAAVTWRMGLRVAGAGSAVVTGLSWLALVGEGTDRVLAHDDTWATLWLTGQVWPLLVAATLVALLAGPRLGSLDLPVELRVAPVAVAHLLVTVTLLAPVRHLGETPMVLVAVAVLAVTGATTRLLPAVWRWSGALTQSLAGVALVVVALDLLAEAGERLVRVAGPVWSGAARDRLPATPGSGPDPWVLPLVVLALLGTVAVVAEARARDRSSLPSDACVAVTRAAARALTVAAALLALAGVGALSLHPVPVWAVTAALLLAAVAALLAWAAPATTTATALVVATLAGAGGLLVSLHSDGLTAVALGAWCLGAGAVHLRSRQVLLAGAAGAALAVAVAGSAWTWGELAGATSGWRALGGLALLALLVLAAPPTPARWWAVRAGTGVVHAGAEVGAAVAAVVVATAGVALVPLAQQASWGAGYLTLAGAVVTTMALLRTDRRELGWAGGLLLAAASWVRLADLGVHAPEAYTLPSATALLLVGLVHLRRHPAAGTWSAVTPGLSLAVVPSLLWVLLDPTGPRVLLLGLGCLVLVVAGARLGWTSPLVVGATAGALLVLRLGAPYVGDAVPRWVLLGAAGALLVALGATWERRLTDARLLADYVRRLR